jgi:hypothetical protein
VSVAPNARHPHAGVWTLLSRAIDYAGLFPPAQLDMAGAVAEYTSYLDSPDSWALGRFVVPVARLDELAAAAAAAQRPVIGSLGMVRSPYGLSVVLGADVAAGGESVLAYNASHDADAESWWGRVEAVELRAATPEAITDAMRLIRARALERYVEIPITADPTALVRAVGAAQAFAKVRTGGTTADAFPSSTDLARFLATCVAEGVPFKATAGLHHPLRGDYPLTYAPGSSTGRMYGFLNVFLATGYLRAGLGEGVAREMLEEQDPSSVRFDGAGVVWRGHRLSASQLADSRGLSIRSFGSCSFREPVDDLTALGLLGT